MRIGQTVEDGEEAINLMPLIDMVFLLLIFFLVATTIASEEREQNMQLPMTSAAAPTSAPPKQLIINILQDGSTKVAGKVRTETELIELLVGMATNDPGREVLIRADERSIHKYFAGVARMCREAGVNELKIGYLFTEQKD